MAYLKALSLVFIATPMLAATLPCTGTAFLANETSVDTFDIEIAANDAERSAGLMYRYDLANDAGMLFLFDRAAPRAFWMKNTPTSLDIAFYDASGLLVGLHQNTVPYSLAPLRSPPAIAVLEVNAGTYDPTRSLLGFSIDDDAACSTLALNHPLLRQK